VTGEAFVITCEHGGNRIPARYLPLFRRRRTLLDSHRGYDPGALVMARTLASAFGAPLVISTVSRLLIDLNRSIGHARLFSEVTRNLPADARSQIVERYYRPHRVQVEGLVTQAVSCGRRVTHISSHSFTPVLNGIVRGADVGLLYDPARHRETTLCACWKAALAATEPRLRVRRNYPYAGKGDGLTAHLRRTFPPESYVGVELEVNQRLVFAGGHSWTALRRALIDSLRAAVA
jgi:predicted N-formylglutamate amidohydrolase